MDAEYDIAAVAPYRSALRYRGSWRRRLGGLFSSMLERIAGVPIAAYLSPALAVFFNARATEHVATFSSLQQLGFLNRFYLVEREPDEPFLYNVRARSPLRKTSGWGYDFFDYGKALWRATGEALERYVWYTSEHHLKNAKTAAYREFSKGDALDILSLAGFSGEQRKQFSELLFDEATPFSWVRGHSLSHNRPLWLPAQLTSYAHCSRRQQIPFYGDQTGREEPMLRWPISTGLATGQTLDQAIVAGALEVIERDAFMVTWLNKRSQPVIDLEEAAARDGDIADVLRRFRRYQLEPYVVKLLSDFSLHSYAGVIIDRSGKGPAFSVGARAHFDAKRAILDSLAEALACRLSLKHTYKEKLPSPERFDRDMRTQYWAKPRKLKDIEFFFGGELVTAAFAPHASGRLLSARDQLAAIVQACREKGCELAYAELTPPAIKKFGLRIVQVVMPQLHPMHLNERIPYRSGPRLKNVPEKLGYTPAANVFTEPHPFP